MDRMNFIPGPKAKAEIHEAEGRIFFNRAAALDYADEFIWNAPGGGLARSPHVRLLYQLVGACLSEGDLVDVWFGLRSPDAGEGESEHGTRPSAEDIGHTWAVLTTGAEGRRQTVWEVGRDTPFAGDEYAVRAFNAYRRALGEHLQQTTAVVEPLPVPRREGNGVDGADESWPRMFRDKAVASRALAPANLYHASARMWYFVDFAPPGRLDEEPVLSRPVRAFDALILSTLVALAYGTPPQVFGVRYKLENIGQMPAGYLRTQYEADEEIREQTDDEILLVM
ncbi:hypothetical protein PWT90_06425 [Aphanocladium album]|nr:hypothetical protein PWT90_06425 [Aphanocladium album]